MRVTFALLFRQGWVLAIALRCLPVSAAPFDQQLNGRVVEHDGGKPVAGAWVIATWDHQGADPVGSRTSCVRLKITRTDELGRFSIELPEFGTEPGVRVFIPRFEQYFAKDTLTDAEAYAQHRLVEVVPFGGTPEKRRYLYTGLSSLRSCRDDNIIDTLMPLYQAVDREASELGLRGNFVKSLEYLKQAQDAERQFREHAK